MKMKELISSVSTILAIAIVGFTLVFSLPLFPNTRSSEQSSKISGCVLYITSITFLLWEIPIWKILHYIWINVCIKWNKFLKQLHITNSLNLYEQICRDIRTQADHKLLAYFFFLGYLAWQIWHIVNEVAVPSCFEGIDLFANVLKLILSSLLLVTIIFNDFPNRQASLLQYTISKIGWAIEVAVCFRCSFRYVVHEVEYVYLDIHKNSKEYGLNLTSNIPQIFKLRAECFEIVVLRKPHAEYILELIPFSTEFFSLATVFCFLKWKHVEQSFGITSGELSMQGYQDEDETNSEVEIDIPSSDVEIEIPKSEVEIEVPSSENEIEISNSEVEIEIPNSEVEIEIPNSEVEIEIPNSEVEIEIPNSEVGIEVPSSENEIPSSGFWTSFVTFCILCDEKFPTRLSLAIIILILTPTSVSIYYFHSSMNSHLHKSGLNIFIAQQFFLQTLVLALELGFYFKVIRRIEPSRVLPKHFQLDSLLLILPLFPLVISLTLRIYPNLAMLEATNEFHLTNSKTFGAILNIILAVYKFVQASFQAIFIQSVLLRYNHEGLHRTGPYFSLLATLNFSIWLSWTLECKLITIHGISQRIFGIVEWMLIIYSTAPFVMFYFAHTTACFVEIRGHIMNSQINRSPASLHNENVSLLPLPPNNRGDPCYGSTRQTGELEVPEFKNSRKSYSV